MVLKETLSLTAGFTELFSGCPKIRNNKAILKESQKVANLDKNENILWSLEV